MALCKIRPVKRQQLRQDNAHDRYDDERNDSAYSFADKILDAYHLRDSDASECQRTEKR